MAISVATCNLEYGGLAEPEHSAEIVDDILTSRPDFAVLTASAGKRGFMNMVEVAKQRFMNEGRYHVAEISYTESEERTQQAMLVLNRWPVGEPRYLRNGGRYGVIWDAHDFFSKSTFRLAGVRLDAHSEPRRVSQVLHLLSGNDIDVIAGDFNALYTDDARTYALQLARPFTKLLPRLEIDRPATPIRHLGSRALELADMAQGTTMQLFEDAGFRDADENYVPTNGFFQLDRLLYAAGIECSEFESRRLPVPDQGSRLKNKLAERRYISAYFGLDD